MAHKVKRRFPFMTLVWISAALIACLSIDGWAGQGKGNGKGGKPPKDQPTCAAFQDDFSGPNLDSSRWVIAVGQAPGYIPGSHIGYYDPANVNVENGYLRIELTQQTGYVDGQNGYISNGGLIYTKNKCGYGTYQWTMRMSATSDTSDGSGAWVLGSVSAGFLYVNNSETEIDFEYSALTPQDVWAVNWLNTRPRRDPISAMATASTFWTPDATARFRTYRFVWAPGVISFYRDGDLVATHTTNVPSKPAYFMINHWGTNSYGWGGPATPNQTRYFYVDSVSYTPLE